jgi:F0F1-type ATP synthase delta subunit
MKYSPHQYATALHDLARETPLAKRRGMVREFLAAVAKNGSLSLLPEIIREYECLSDKEKKLRHVTVRAPERLPESGIARKLHFPPAHGFGRAGKVKVKSERDARLMGGAVIEVDDLRVDNSIRMRLERARQAFTK